MLRVCKGGVAVILGLALACASWLLTFYRECMFLRIN